MFILNCPKLLQNFTKLFLKMLDTYTVYTQLSKIIKPLSLNCYSIVLENATSTLNCLKLSRPLSLNCCLIVIDNATSTLNCPKLSRSLTLNCYSIVIGNATFTLSCLKLSQIFIKLSWNWPILSKITQKFDYRYPTFESGTAPNHHNFP
jgi:hypothetical protein